MILERVLLGNCKTNTISSLRVKFAEKYNKHVSSIMIFRLEKSNKILVEDSERPFECLLSIECQD